MGSFMVNLYPRFSGSLMASGVDFSKLSNDDLIKNLQNISDPKNQAEAAKEIGRRGVKKALPYLKVAAQHDPNYTVRYRAKNALAKLAKSGAKEAAEAIVGVAPKPPVPPKTKPIKPKEEDPILYLKTLDDDNLPSDWRNPNDMGSIPKKKIVKIFGTLVILL